jgi:hypothetical protein
MVRDDDDDDADEVEDARQKHNAQHRAYHARCVRNRREAVRRAQQRARLTTAPVRQFIPTFSPRVPGTYAYAVLGTFRRGALTR